MDISSPGNLDFICQNEELTQDKYFNLLITIQDASLFVTLQEQDQSDASIQIKNNLKEYELVVHQYGVANCSYTVPSEGKIPFAWLQPSLNNVIIVKLSTPSKRTSSEIKCKLQDINKSITEVVMLGSSSVIVSYIVSLSGRSRVVEFFIGHEKDEKKEEECKFLLRANLPSLGISLISAASNKKYELAYISLTPFLLVVVDKGDSTALQVRVKSIVVDNNSRYDLPYPVIVFPQNLKKLQERDLPCFDFICKIKNKQKESDVK